MPVHQNRAGGPQEEEGPGEERPQELVMVAGQEKLQKLVMVADQQRLLDLVMV